MNAGFCIRRAKTKTIQAQPSRRGKMQSVRDNLVVLSLVVSSADAFATAPLIVTAAGATTA